MSTSWSDGLVIAGSCPRCGVRVFLRVSADDPALLPTPVYLCDCRNLAPAPCGGAPVWPSHLMGPMPFGGWHQPPLPAPAPVLMPTPCQHCYCERALGVGSGEHARCCKCGSVQSVGAPARVTCEGPRVGGSAVSAVMARLDAVHGQAGYGVRALHDSTLPLRR